MKKLIIILIIGCICFSAGCTGSFKLTRALHQWQTSFDSQWVDEAVFLGCVIIPVYEVAMLGDGFIFNVVEFWTGNNPMGSARLEGEGKGVEMVLKEDGSILVSDGRRAFTLERTAVGVVAKDPAGNVLYRAVKDVDGVISLYDGAGKLVQESRS
jgi:hypothetical protein